MINRLIRPWALWMFSAAILIFNGCNNSTPFHCTDPIGCVTLKPGEAVEIGVMQVLSGGLKAQGLMHVRGIEMCLQKHGNQILGHPVQLHVTDSGCSEEAGINAALSLTTNPGIVGIIGTYCSSSAIASIPLVSKAGMVMISGTNSAPSLTSFAGKKGVNNYPGYFRTMYNGKKMAETAAVFAHEKLGLKRAATINSGDSFTVELTKEFERKFTDLGGITVQSMGINRGDKDMGPALEAVAYSKPDVLYFPLFQPEAVSVIVQARGTPGLEKIVLIGEIGASSGTFLKAVGEAGIGLHLSAPDKLSGKEYHDLLQDYEARYGEKPIHFSLPHVYDAASLLLSAIESVAVKDDRGMLHIGRDALRKALYGTKDYKGITGSLTCDPFGDTFGGSCCIIRLDDLSGGLEKLEDNVVYRYR